MLLNWTKNIKLAAILGMQQEPKTRSKQLPCAWSRRFHGPVYLLERFWCEFWISFKFHKPVSITYRPSFLISYTSNELIDMVEILFSREKVPLNVSKNKVKLVRKNAVT